MEKELEKLVLLKIDNLIDLVKNDSLYQKYLSLESKMKNNKEIKSIMDSIKVCQRASVLAKEKNDTKKMIENDKEIEEKLKELEEYPLYIDFIETQEELNQVFQLIKEKMSDIFNERTQ